MQIIKVKCPAKVNLTLEILNKRPNGYHNIKSIMQMISLYDYLTIKIEHADKNRITLYGLSTEIPYDETNLVYKAAMAYLQKANIHNLSINIFIDKNIPVAAGLAGGSSDAAGTLWGLNYLLSKLETEQLDEICASLGSDLNVCLHGGRLLATSRGEIIESLPFTPSDISLIKPKNLGISAGYAYKKYSQKEHKPQNNNTEKMINAICKENNIGDYLYNDLEYAVFEDYKELQMIKKTYPQAIMSGSGSTYFVLENIENFKLDENYQFINNLCFIPDGVSKVE